MAYIGNTPADKTLKLEKQQFTTSATTSYTLDHSVSDPQSIALFINNVRQNPNSSYTVSGTALTLSEATASTDTMYCVFLGRSIGTVGIGAGEVTKDKLDLISDSTAGLTVKGDGGSNDGYLQLNCRVNSHGIKLKSPPHSAGATYTLTFPNSVTADKFLKTDGSGNLSFADAGGTNTPSFHVYASSGQTVTAGTTTKVVFNTEVIDTDNAFATNTFTVPSGKGGKYLMYSTLHNSSREPSRYAVQIRQNNSEKLQLELGGTQSFSGTTVSGLVNASAGDTFDVYYYNNESVDMVIDGGISKMFFGGFKLL